MTTARIALPMDQVADFCRRWKIVEFALFGSVLRDDFRPDSDVDVLVTFAPDAPMGQWGGISDLMDMEEELERIFGREVDLVERPAVEQDRNWIRRRLILDAAETIYVAR